MRPFLRPVGALGIRVTSQLVGDQELALFLTCLVGRPTEQMRRDPCGGQLEDRDEQKQANDRPGP